MRYKQSNSSTWITGHPLFRIQPGYDDDLSASGNNADAFAWPLIGMIPGTTYNIEVTVSSGSISDIRTLTHTTKALPPAAGTANKTIVAGSSNTQIIATLSTLNPGDVLEFKNGTYNVSGISINQRNGTVSAPIYIRGESRSGVILRNPSGTIMQINSSNMIIENMTLQGPGIDSGVNTDSKGIVFFSGNPETGVTIRNMTITGVDLGIKSYAMVQGIMIYNNTLVGNNRWDQDLYAYGGGGVPGAGDGIPDLDQNVFWNDDGICAAGLGNVAFNNTLSGFGDSFAFAAQNDSTSIGVHFYRNEVRNSGDDLLEADYGRRNVSFYDNRSHNSMTALSLDPIKGGPMLYARNIVINAGRTPFKWNSDNAGQFILDNTIVRPARGGTGLDIAGWYAPNNGEQHNIGFQNNVFVYKGASASLLWLDNGGNINKNIDWTNNSWYPDGAISINGVGSWPSLASARAGIPAGQALFSGINKMFTNDTILPADPFTVPILLGPNHWTNVTGTYTPTLLSASSAKNSGVVIPNINDGYSGSAPDRGAIIEGIANPIWGDPSSQPINIPSALSQNSILSNLAVNTALDLKPSTNYDCPNLLGHATCATRSDYSRFTYDSAQQKMLFFGGGHGSTSTFMDNLDTLSTASGSSLDWVEDYPTTPCSEMILANMSTIDLTAPGDGGDGKWATTGHPYALHTYDMMVYHPVLKRLIILTKA